MTKKPVIPWLEIKAEYLNGTTPQEISIRYNVDVEKVYKKIDHGKWKAEKRAIEGKIGETVQSKVERVTNKAIDELEGIIDDPETEKNIKVQACKAILDISGLKSSKQEINGNVGIQKVFITPDEMKETDEHIDNVLNEQ